MDGGVRTGLVTNIGAKAINQALAGLELAEYINAVVTRNDVELLKPSGEGIRAALRKLGGDKSAALFVGDSIGDSITDIVAAREAGVPVSIAQGGESDPDSLARGIGNLSVVVDPGLVLSRGEVRRIRREVGIL
jgi:phosphoglycolate phosphatase-like HAD superfamily hydrolase